MKIDVNINVTINVNVKDNINVNVNVNMNVNVNENVNSLPILVNSGLSIELLLITVAIDKLLELPSLKI